MNNPSILLGDYFYEYGNYYIQIKEDNAHFLHYAN